MTVWKEPLLEKEEMPVNAFGCSTVPRLTSTPKAELIVRNLCTLLERDGQYSLILSTFNTLIFYFQLYICLISIHAIYMAVQHFIICIGKDWKGMSICNFFGLLILLNKVNETFKLISFFNPFPNKPWFFMFLQYKSF